MKLEKTASRVNQYYGIGAVIALGVIGGFGYYIYRTKKGEQPSNPQQNNPKPHPQVQLQTLQSGALQGLTSLRWIKALLYHKNGQEYSE